MQQDEINFLAQNNIQIISMIAQGGFGTVYYVYCPQYQNYYALKKVQEKRFKQMEVDCLQAIDDISIVRLYKYYNYNGFYYMLMEYCPIDLDRMMKTDPKELDDNLKYYIKGMIMAVKACHDRRIAHCDIKPSNFMLDRYERVKIGDFGLSTLFSGDPKCPAFKGTVHFMPPEIFDQEEYSPLAADIWSLGCTIYYVATGVLPFLSQNPRELLFKIANANYSVSNIKDPLLADLIHSCMVLEPRKRATIKELLEMPYLLNATYKKLKRGRSDSLPCSKTAQKPLLLKAVPNTNYSQVKTLRTGILHKAITASREHIHLNNHAPLYN